MFTTTILVRVCTKTYLYMGTKNVHIWIVTLTSQYFTRIRVKIIYYDFVKGLKGL